MKDLTWIRENLIAHRGLHSKDGTIPENSYLAYRKALEKGYSIELDVNVLKDGTVMAFHDLSFKRLCNDPRVLAEATYEDIKDLTLLSTDQKVIRFEEALKLVNGDVPLLIELKPFGNVNLLCASLMKSLENYQGRYAVFSFQPQVVRWFKKHHPEVIRGQISEYFSDNKNMNFIMKYLLKIMFFNRFNKPDFISYGIHDLPNKYLDKFMKKGITIISYAARTQSEFDLVKSHYHNTVFEFFEPKK